MADGELFLLTLLTWEVPRGSPLPKSAQRDGSCPPWARAQRLRSLRW